MPREVRYRGRRGEEAHLVYTKEEADAEGVPYFPKWRDFEHVGQWILTDDNYVVEVLASGKMRTGTRWIRTCTGTFLASPGTRLDTEPRDSRYTFNGLSPKDQPFRVTARIEQWARLYAQGMHPIKAYIRVFNSSSEANAERRVHMLLQKREVLDIVKEELDAVFKELGIDDKFIIRGYKDIFENGDNDNARLASLNSLAKIRGMLQPKKQESSTQVFLGFGEQKLEELEGGNTGQAIPAPAPSTVVDVDEAEDAEVEGLEDFFQEE